MECLDLYNLAVTSFLARARFSLRNRQARQDATGGGHGMVLHGMGWYGKGMGPSDEN